MSLVQKLHQELEALKTELQVCRRKLDSKCEALLILSKDLDQCRQERDQFKLMAEQVQERYQALKRQLAGIGPRSTNLEDMNFREMKSQNLASLLCDLREGNKSLQFEVDDYKQKLNDAQGDIKLLREQIARQRVGTTDEGMNTRHFPAHEREDLVKQLEGAREQMSQMERDLQQVLDEKEEYVTERDVYKNKYERLNTELNYILKGDENRIVDIDALTMENKYLQDRLTQMEEEKSMAMATVSKYKSLLERRKTKGVLKLGQNRTGGVVVTQKQVHQLLETRTSPTPQTMADLQALATALLDTVNDKNLALSHQRKTNKILGARVSELEKKLKTLEVSGLWNIPGGGKNDVVLQKLRQECENIKTLIPRQMSTSSEASRGSGSEVPDDHLNDDLEESSMSSHTASPERRPAPPGGDLRQLELEDLDLLPTKDVSAEPESPLELHPELVERTYYSASASKAAYQDHAGQANNEKPTKVILPSLQESLTTQSASLTLETSDHVPSKTPVNLAGEPSTNNTPDGRSADSLGDHPSENTAMPVSARCADEHIDAVPTKLSSNLPGTSLQVAYTDSKDDEKAVCTSHVEEMPIVLSESLSEKQHSLVPTRFGDKVVSNVPKVLLADEQGKTPAADITHSSLAEEAGNHATDIHGNNVCDENADVDLTDEEEQSKQPVYSATGGDTPAGLTDSDIPVVSLDDCGLPELSIGDEHENGDASGDSSIAHLESLMTHATNKVKEHTQGDTSSAAKHEKSSADPLLTKN